MPRSDMILTNVWQTNTGTKALTTSIDLSEEQVNLLSFLTRQGRKLLAGLFVPFDFLNKVVE